MTEYIDVNVTDIYPDFYSGFESDKAKVRVSLFIASDGCVELANIYKIRGRAQHQAQTSLNGTHHTSVILVGNFFFYYRAMHLVQRAVLLR